MIRLQRLNELSNLDILENKQYIYENYKASINEISRINVKEFYGYFPYNKYDIKFYYFIYINNERLLLLMLQYFASMLLNHRLVNI